MSGKYLIFGATGSIGSNLAKLMASKNQNVHLIGRDENGLNLLSSELSCKYSVVDVLDEQSVKNLKNEFTIKHCFKGFLFSGMLLSNL